ncbi:MAG: hypothetical protein OEM59_19470 [Rhodospirillales bacterium]|nr:hypothetical protein [Rhodospirillales bacterium]
MLWLEGLVPFGCGWFFWWMSNGAWPQDIKRRQNLERSMPWVKNKPLMRTAAVFMWFFGGAIVLNRYFGLGLGF